MGYGAALAAVLFVIILIITIIQWQSGAALGDRI